LSNSSVIISLGRLLIGSIGIVAELTVDSVARRRFVEMGLISGREVTAVRSTPLDDPVEYFVLDSLVALRSRHTRHVVVEVTP